MHTGAANNSFQTTHWSVVRRAAEGNGDEASSALSAICQSYWYPIYAFYRRFGKSPEDAGDLTQGFFLRLVQRGLLASADRERGRLRTFLLTCARNYMTDQNDRDHTARRAVRPPVQVDPVLAESRYAIEPADELSPDRLYQRRWSLEILERSLRILEREQVASGSSELFLHLRPFLGFGADPDKRYADVATNLSIPVGTLKNKVFRLRERWREILFEQVADTLVHPTPEEIKAELSELLGCV